MGLIYRDEEVCLFCKEPGNKELDYICRDCFDRLSFNSGYHEVEGYEYVYSVLDYDRSIRGHIHAYKNGHRSYYYKVFGELMVYEILREGIFKDLDYIIAVPLHRRKRAFRGYNQSELLGDYIGEILGIDSLNDLAYKTRSTRDQHSLNSSERRKNLHKAFSIRDGDRIRGKKILLVDDVLTTGTTMERIGEELLAFEPKSLYGLSLSTVKD